MFFCVPMMMFASGATAGATAIMMGSTMAMGAAGTAVACASEMMCGRWIDDDDDDRPRRRRQRAERDTGR